MIEKNNFVGLILNQLVSKENNNYDEDKIIFYINMALKVLSAELDLNIKCIKTKLLKGVEYPYPLDFIKLIGVKSANEELKIVNYEYYANNNTNNAFIVLDTNSFFSTKDISAEIYYSYFDEIKISNLYINIPLICEKALYYQTMMLAKEMILSTNKSLEQAAYFKNMYDIEILKCKNLLNHKHRAYETKYIGV